MTKQEFTVKLTLELSGLPKAEVEERVCFYGEMIDDRIEAGLTEEDAVADIGSIEDIVSQILSDIPLGKIVKEKIKPKRRFTWWEITLISIGSPIWLALLISAFAVVISAYAVLWSLVASIWAIDAALAGVAIGGIVYSILCFCHAAVPSGLAVLGLALFSAGVALAFLFVCRIATVGTARLTKKIAIGIKRLFIKKEERK